MSCRSRGLVILALALAAFLSSRQAPAQVKVTAQKLPTQYPSPMELEIPIPEGFIENGVRPWRIVELKEFICNEVTIENLTVTWRPARTKKGIDRVELFFYVTTFTRPPQDMKATFTFWFRSDDEDLLLVDKYNRRATPLVVDAEETKTISRDVTLFATAEPFLRILHGPNPRLVVRVTSVEN